MLLSGALYGLSAILLWSIAPVLMKTQADNLPLTFLLLLRYGLSSLIFVPVLRGVAFRRLPWRAGLKLAACLGLHLSMQVLAIRQLQVTWYVVFFSLAPIISLFLLRLCWTPQMRLGVVLAVFGSLLFVRDSRWEQISFLGFACLALSVVSWAWLSVLLKDLQSQFNDWQVTALCNLLSFAVFVLLWIANRCPQQTLTLSDWGAIGALSLGMPLAFFLFTRALRLTPTVALFVQYLEPVFGVLFGVWFFHEVLETAQIAGTTLILAASVLILRNSQKESSP
jgi:drug/metabolite transporter (DMT)-like permease